MSGELPEGWASARLDNLLVTGVFSDGDWVESKDQDPNGDVRLVQLADVGDGCYRNKSARFLTRAKAKELGCTFLQQGDILIARMPDPLGRACEFPGDSKASVTVVDVCIARPAKDGPILPRLLMYEVNSWRVRSMMEEHERGTTRKRISRTNLGSLELAVAPLAEQRRIVNQVEALLEQVSRAKGRLDRVPLILKRFRQAVLAAACSGELTKECRGGRTDDARALLATLGVGAVTADEEPALDIPTTWRWAATEDLCDKSRAITYGVIKLGEPVDGGVPTLRSSDVRPLFIDERGVKRIAPEIAKQYTRTFLRGGEVLVTVRGTLGGIAVVPQRMAGFNISREVAQLPIRSEMNADFVAFAVASITSQNWLGERAKGVAYTGINIEDLRRLPLPVPPPGEQAEVVHAVRRLFALADTIERRVQVAISRADRLPQAILSKAFSGELVPTEADLARAAGRTYETAEELLARGRGEAEVTPVEQESGNRVRRPRRSGRATG